MRRHVLAPVLAVACLAGMTDRLDAQPAGAPSIVTPQRAAALLDEPGIAVLHVGDKAEYQKQALLKGAGVTPGTKVVTYCHIGQQATVPWLLISILGYDVQVFDGCHEEWARTDGAPVKTGTRP